MNGSLFHPDLTAYQTASSMFAEATSRVGNTPFNEARRRLESTFQVSPPREKRPDVELNERVRFKIRSITEPLQTMQHGVIQLKIAGGALTAARHFLDEMKTLIGTATDTAESDGNRTASNSKLAQFVPEELDKIINRAKYNGKSLLDGTFSAVFKMGTINSKTTTFDVQLADMRSAALDLRSLNISTKSGADAAYSKIEQAQQSMTRELNAVRKTESRMSRMLNKQTDLSESLVGREQLPLRSSDQAKQMVQSLKSTLLSIDSAVLKTDKLHLTNNETVFQLLVTALDLEKRWI